MASYLLTIPHHLLVHHRTNWKQFPRSVALSSPQEWRCSWHLILVRVLEKKECGVQWLREELHLDGLFFLGGIKGKDQGTVCVTKGKKKKSSLWENWQTANNGHGEG